LDSSEGLDRAEHIAIIGRGYSDEDDAWAAAKRWRGYVERGFARVNFPADFGDRAPAGGFTEYGLEAAEAARGRRVLNDDHATVFLEDPWPLFARVGPLELTVGRTKSAVLAAIDTAAKLDLQVPDHHALAYDLFSASFWQPSEDSRFMMLMMALETMLEAEPRSEATQAHIDNLVSLTQSADLPETERSSIVGALDSLREESISQAGRRLASTLGERRYNGRTPMQFFNDCYAIRSGLAHGHSPRPSVDGKVATLEQFVANLLSAELLDTVDPEAISGAQPD
jgi:hypothetical protein